MVPSSASLGQQVGLGDDPDDLVVLVDDGERADPLSRSMTAISLYPALRLTAITWVLMTSLTVEFMSVASCSGARVRRRRRG